MFSLLTLGEMHKESNQFRDYKSSGVVKNKWSYLVWLGEDKGLGWMCEVGVGGGVGGS